MFKFFLIAAFVACASAVAIPWEACEGGLPGPVSFRIPECPGVPCGLAIGDEVTMQIAINIPGGAFHLPVTTVITVADGSFEFPLGTGDACNAISAGCPVVEGIHFVTFPVRLAGVQPGEQANIRVQINNHGGQVIACGAVTTVFS